MSGFIVVIPHIARYGPGRAERRPVGRCTIPAFAMTADRRHRPMDRQHDQHHRRPAPQRQCDRAEHGSQRRAAAYGDQRVHTISVIAVTRLLGFKRTGPDLKVAILKAIKS